MRVRDTAGLALRLFILMYNPAVPDKSEKVSDNADKHRHRIAADISERNRNKVSFKENLAFKFFTKLE
jgi:hypothetical protein